MMANLNEADFFLFQITFRLIKKLTKIVYNLDKTYRDQGSSNVCSNRLYSITLLE